MGIQTTHSGHWTLLMTLFNDSDFQGAPVGGADEPGLPVQEEADQRGQTDKTVGTWGSAGDFVIRTIFPVYHILYSI